MSGWLTVPAAAGWGLPFSFYLCPASAITLHALFLQHRTHVKKQQSHMFSKDTHTGQAQLPPDCFPIPYSYSSGLSNFSAHVLTKQKELQ